MIVFLWIIIPIVTVFIYSYKIPVFNYFRFLFILPAFYLVITAGVTVIKSNYAKRIIISLILLLNLVSTGIYYLDSKQQREDWKSAVAMVEEKIKSNEIVGFGYPEPFAPYRWYATNPGVARGFTDSIAPGDENTAEITGNLISGISGVYYFEYLNDLSQPNRIVQKTIENNGLFIDKIYNFNGVGLIYYYTK